ncbi:hypothetical protein FJZ18_01030 [Candidatus Pacearchaeota archaeon]|nr:hypothetical protein [Candidatus Pacearchaeota archaeon]
MDNTSTENPVKIINQIITNTDIFVFSYNPQTKLYTYSRPFTLQEATLLATDTNTFIKNNYASAKGLQGSLDVDPVTAEIYNISTLKGILVNQVLTDKTKETNNPQRLPTIQEGIQHYNAGLLNANALCKDILVDHGIAVYSDDNPDQEVAQALIETSRTAVLNSAEQEINVLPLVASFSSLGLRPGGKCYGVLPVIVSSKGLIYGEKAQDFLNDNNFIQDINGVHGVVWDYYDSWCASWDDNLNIFYSNCRLGRLIAEGSAEILEDEIRSIFAPTRWSLDAILLARE